MPIPASLPAILAGAGIAGGTGIASALINRSAARTQPTSSTGKSTQTTTTGISPAFDPLQQALLDISMKNLTSPLPAGYEEKGIGAINETFNLGRESLESQLAQRGLYGSPVVGSALGRLETGRLGEIGSFRAGLPMLERELQGDALRQALSLYAMGPRMSTVTGDVSSTGTTTYPGSAAGSGIADSMSMLAYLYGQGLFG